MVSCHGNELCVCLHAGVCVRRCDMLVNVLSRVGLCAVVQKGSSSSPVSRLCLCPVQPLEDALSPVLPST